MHSELSSARTVIVIGMAMTMHVIGSISGCGADAEQQSVSSGAKQGAAGSGTRVAVALPAHTAGKACTADADCGQGSCSKQLSTPGGLFGGGASSLSAPGGYCSGACAVSADCGEGGTCVMAQALGGLAFPGASAPATAGPSGNCFAMCAANADCREGYRCFNASGQAIPTASGTAAAGTCQPTPPVDELPDSVVGSACSAATDCGVGTCMTSDAFGLNMSGYPGGYCTGRCVEDADCGATGVCTAGLGGGVGTCYRKCQSDAECGRDGYRCRSATTPGFPNQAASTSKQCTPGAKPLSDGVVGNTCSADTDCGGEAMSCKTELAGQAGAAATPLPGGYCTVSCVEAADCGAGGVCANAFGGIIAGSCYKACASAADCRAGYSCGTPPAPGLPGGMGFPGGGMVPGGMVPGGMAPGGMMPGGMMPGGGMIPGGTTQTVCSPTTVSDQDAGTP